MLAVMEFIFSSLWVFLGTVILLAIVVNGVGNILLVLTGREPKD